MDASAYLQKQGWRGDGHSLDHSDRGIKKPLLVSKKVDVLGVGLNKHKAVSDQWWLRAFDQGLKTFGTGKESALGAVQKHGINRGGLYARFTQGEGVPGSIGQSPVGGSEFYTGTTKPVDMQSRVDGAMAVDFPPAIKLERVVGKVKDGNEHDAMMHVLQNPDDAPADMHKMLDKKRKRAEQHVEKRARRKVERSEKSRDDARESRRQAKENGVHVNGSFDEAAISRKAEQYVLEAQQRGIIPLGPSDERKCLLLNGTRREPDEEFVAIIKRAGLDPYSPSLSSGKGSEKAQKYAREKLKRTVKRAATEYLEGDRPARVHDVEEKLGTAEKGDPKARKEGVAQKQENQTAGNNQRVEQKRQRRAVSKAAKEEIGRQLAAAEANDGAGNDKETNDTDMLDITAFDTGADEVLLSLSSLGRQKSISGVGALDRYPTKAEKKSKKLAAMALKEGTTEEEVKQRITAEQARKDAGESLKVDKYRAMKQGLSLEAYRASKGFDAVQTPTVERKKLRPEKLTGYTRRAHEKGVSLEEYIRRRNEKYAAKQGAKLGDTPGNELAASATASGNANSTEALKQRPTAMLASPSSGDNDLGFVVDTAGDDSLAVKPPTGDAVEVNRVPLAIVDAEGDATHTVDHTQAPFPLDPSLWEAIKPKDMPKPMRKAREGEGGAVTEAAKKKDKGQRKVEARESFAKDILARSRKAKTSDCGASVTIDGVANVPLVKLKSREGKFSREETALARTVARTVLKDEKREAKTKKGKGKGWKKRERVDREKGCGISNGS